MSLGCPVICSPVASLPEVGGKAAFWTELDPAAYRKAMHELAGNPALRADLVHAGREQSALFTWANCAERTAEIYRAI
jgi:alpha-1,3-rhamnosyl/mannosyltransferase